MTRPTEPEDLSAREAASDIIARYIRDAIINGQISEGKPVRQDKIAQLFNVSKIPVREALKRLEAEGFISFQPNRGAIVTEMSIPDILQIFEVRAVLESAAIRFSVPNMKAETLLRAEQYCKRFYAEPDIARWGELNAEFHACLYADANRPYLMSMIQSVNNRIERYLKIQLTLSHGKATADREHRAIIKACRDGDADAAATLIHAHIMDACDSLAKHLRKRSVTANTG